MYDALQVLQAAVTKTTAFNSTAVDLINGTPRRGLDARLLISNYSAATAGAVWTPTIEHSDDNTTFTTLSTGTAVTCGTAAAASTQFIPLETSKRYVRLAVALSPTTGTPTITYSAKLGEARP